MSGKATLYLVRHGEAAANWTEDRDPGLSALGREQSTQIAATLFPLGPLPIISSPLARAKQTAAALASLWSAGVAIANAVTEIPSPQIAIPERRAWLTALMQGGWSAATPELRAWRKNVITFLTAQKCDCIIFSHFIAINAAVGACFEVDDVVPFRPANASVTLFETDGTRLTLIQKGDEATSVVN